MTAFGSVRREGNQLFVALIDPTDGTLLCPFLCLLGISSSWTCIHLVTLPWRHLSTNLLRENENVSEALIVLVAYGCTAIHSPS